MLRPTLFVHRATDGNVGDELSSPYTYFRSSHPHSLRLEVHLPADRVRGRLKRALFRRVRDRAQAIIVGGGGLLGNDYFRDDLRFWTDGPAPAILWGAGHNAHDPMGIAQIFPDETQYAQLIPFSSIGLRDQGPGFAWVPCASCMHPGLSTRPSRTGPTLFVLHRDLRHKPDQLSTLLVAAPADREVIFNDDTAEAIFGKLGSAGQVVTNSFHAAYWATLLQKPVVAIGGGTKVGLLKHPVPLADNVSWPDIIRTAPLYPNALEECRDRNSDFNAHVVREFTGGRGRIRLRPAERNPVAERNTDFSGVKQALPAMIAAKVPKVIHFVFGLSADFGGRPFNIMHMLAVRSAAERFRPEQMFFHHEFEPDNAFFREVKSLLTLMPTKAPTRTSGNAPGHFAHPVDIVRLQTLKEFGGVYLDLDTITVASLDPLLSSSFTIGLQGKTPLEGFGNAVMAAAPQDPFVTAWLARYDDLAAAPGDCSSVQLPYLMWRSGKFSANVKDYDYFHWPYCDDPGLRMMFEEDHIFDRALLHHLWEKKSFPKYFADESLAEATRRVRNMGSTYSRLADVYL
jgi:hypothetical protein